MTTAYILTAIRFAEADLITIHGEKYRRYGEQVPMIVPALRLLSQGESESSGKIAAVN